MIQVPGAAKVTHYNAFQVNVVRDDQSGEPAIVVIDGTAGAHVFPLPGEHAETVENGIRAARSGVQVASRMPPQDGARG